MQFCDYKGYTAHIPREGLGRAIEKVIARDRTIPADTAAAARIEVLWHELSRPYYNVYPGIQASLEKLDLSKVRLDMLSFPYEAIAIRTQKDGAALIAHSRDRGALIIVIDAGEQLAVLTIKVKDKATFGEIVAASSGLDAMAIQFLTLACGCGLLGEGILEAEVLSRDYNINPILSPEKYTAAIDRARRRGKVGWTVGKAYEVIPHVRNPHLAVMWTGHGRTIQKVIMRSGCIVHRRKAEQLPTGFKE